MNRAAAWRSWPSGGFCRAQPAGLGVGDALRGAPEPAGTDEESSLCLLLGSLGRYSGDVLPSLVTHDVRVAVESHYEPARSDPARRLWFFVYRIRIENRGERVVKLLSRHWIITDAHGSVEEVRGPGVVGQQPSLAPGEAFEYSSGCPLRTPFGSMHGTYQMTHGADDVFDVTVPAFALRDPRNMQ